MMFEGVYTHVKSTNIFFYLEKWDVNLIQAAIYIEINHLFNMFSALNILILMRTFLFFCRSS